MILKHTQVDRCVDTKDIKFINLFWILNLQFDTVKCKHIQRVD